MRIHVVQSGDTIFSIANQYHITARQLMADNAIDDADLLTLGQALLILEPASTYLAEPGDTVSSIAARFGIAENTLLQYNPTLSIHPFIHPGQTIILSYQSDPLGEYFVNGYAYPYIQENLLRETLPYLSYLSIFSYGFSADGRLQETTDTALLAAAHESGAAPILVLTPFDETGLFSNTLISAMLHSPTARDLLIQQLVAVMAEKGYYGIDIDFEYILQEDKALFLSFLEQTRDAMHENGLLLFVALAPKTSADQVGLLYESHDYARVGSIADYVFLMTYEWGYAFGPPMAVAPLNMVRRVLDYAITEIPPEKIIMGIPNYGYNWVLPHTQGESRAYSLGNQEAVQMAMQLRAEVLYDEVAQSPYFFYTDTEGLPHVVWFEDVRSMDATLRTAAEYGFHGVGYWNIMRPFRQNWMLLSNLFQIARPAE